MLVTLKGLRVNWLIVLSFEGSRDPSVSDIITKVDMKLTMTRSHYYDESVIIKEGVSKYVQPCNMYFKTLQAFGAIWQVECKTSCS